MQAPDDSRLHESHFHDSRQHEHTPGKLKPRFRKCRPFSPRSMPRYSRPSNPSSVHAHSSAVPRPDDLDKRVLSRRSVPQNAVTPVGASWRDVAASNSPARVLTHRQSSYKGPSWRDVAVHNAPRDSRVWTHGVPITGRLAAGDSSSGASSSKKKLSHKSAEFIPSSMREGLIGTSVVPSALASMVSSSLISSTACTAAGMSISSSPPFPIPGSQKQGTSKNSSMTFARARSRDQTLIFEMDLEIQWPTEEDLHKFPPSLAGPSRSGQSRATRKSKQHAVMPRTSRHSSGVDERTVIRASGTPRGTMKCSSAKAPKRCEFCIDARKLREEGFNAECLFHTCPCAESTCVYDEGGCSKAGCVTCLHTMVSGNPNRATKSPAPQNVQTQASNSAGSSSKGFILGFNTSGGLPTGRPPIRARSMGGVDAMIVQHDQNAVRPSTGAGTRLQSGLLTLASLSALPASEGGLAIVGSDVMAESHAESYRLAGMPNHFTAATLISG